MSHKIYIIQRLFLCSSWSAGHQPQCLMVYVSPRGTDSWYNFSFIYLFYFVYRIGQERLDGLLAHYRKNGLTPKEKLSGGRKKTSFAFQDMRRAAAFISNYAEEHALVLPGRVPGFRRDDVKLLPSSETQIKVYRAYINVMKQSGI